LLGVGSVPSPASDFVTIFDSDPDDEGYHGCNAASFSWGAPSVSPTFPTHSYRLQRIIKNFSSAAGGINKTRFNASEQQHSSGHALQSAAASSSDLLANSSSNNEGGGSAKVAVLREARVSSSSKNSWVTLYSGVDMEYTDLTLDPDVSYSYRLQAWNSVGHSTWVSVDVPLRSKCVSKLHRSNNYYETSPWGGGGRGFTNADGSYNNVPFPSPVFSYITFFVNGIVTFFVNLYYGVSLTFTVLQLFFTSIALVTAVIRLRSGNTSTIGSKSIYFPSLWRGLNAFFVRTVGAELIPGSMISEFEGVNRTQHNNINNNIANGDGDNDDNNNTVDRKLLGTGLSHGSMKNLRGGIVFSDYMENRRAATPVREGHGGASSNDNSSGEESSRNSFERTPLKKFFSSKSLLKKTISMRGKNSLKSRSLSPNSAQKRTSAIHASSTNNKSSSSSSSSSKRGSTGSTGSETFYEECWSDISRCNWCEKKYKIGKRYRHQCARCLSTFCHKHGRTTHSNFTSCQVPGSCVCMQCLNLESLRNGEQQQQQQNN
jgi:hypothetical protein